MSVRTRGIIIGVVLVSLVLAVAGGRTFRRVEVVDGLSPEDIAQIRKGIRSEIWRQAVPEWSWSFSHVKSIPRRVRRAFQTNIDPPQRWENVSGQHTERNGQGTVVPENSWMVFTSDGGGFIVEKRQGHWWINGHD